MSVRGRRSRCVHEVVLLWHWSHIRAVVRVCCKYDDQCEWERLKFDPLPPLNPLTDRHQNLPTWLRCGYLPFCKISSSSDRGFVSTHARFRASNCLLGYLFVFWVLQIVYSQDARTDFDAKYVKDVPFGGRKKTKVKLFTPFCPKTAILRPFFDGTCIVV